jgi:hypothetical protein
MKTAFKNQGYLAPAIRTNRNRIDWAALIFWFITASLYAPMIGMAAEDQKVKKIARIGYLSTIDATRDSDRTEAIRLTLRELGYREGQNIAFEFRYAEGKLDRYPESL